VLLDGVRISTDGTFCLFALAALAALAFVCCHLDTVIFALACCFYHDIFKLS
jgi:hypothetical protein